MILGSFICILILNGSDSLLLRFLGTDAEEVSEMGTSRHLPPPNEIWRTSKCAAALDAELSKERGLDDFYAAPEEGSATAALERFSDRWDKKYPKISQSWRDNWANLSTYFKCPAELRRLIYTTNTIEGFNRQLRKVTKGFIFPFF